MFLFLFLVLLVYTFVNVYVLFRITSLVTVTFPILNKSWVMGIFVALGLSFFLYMAVFRNSRGIIPSVLSRASTSWLVVLLYGFLFFALFDLGKGLFHYFKIDFSKKLPIEWQTMVFYVFVMYMGNIFAWGSYLARSTKVSHYTVKVDKKVQGLNKLRIIVATDIHLGQMMGRERLRKKILFINEQKPDIILFVGDVLDGELEPVLLQGSLEEFKALKSQYGVFAVLGNHEYYGLRSKKGREDALEHLINEFQKNGINVLKDEAKLIEDSFYVVGRQDIQSQQVFERKRTALEDLFRYVDVNKPVILMDHQPIETDAVANMGVDLQLAGHTHRGQLWPFNYITQRIFKKDYGLLVTGKTHLIVSSGLGTWGPVVRLGSRSEIVQIDMQFNNKKR